MEYLCLMSLVEAATNMAIGYGGAITVQLLTFPRFGLPARLDDVFSTGTVCVSAYIA